jgi:hypothetical protein
MRASSRKFHTRSCAVWGKSRAWAQQCRSESSAAAAPTKHEIAAGRTVCSAPSQMSRMIQLGQLVLLGMDRLWWRHSELALVPPLITVPRTCGQRTLNTCDPPPMNSPCARNACGKVGRKLWPRVFHSSSHTAEVR